MFTKKMENEKCAQYNHKKETQNMKDIFSKLVTLTNEINVLHEHVSISRNAINVEPDGPNVIRNKSIDDMDPVYMENSSTPECSNETDILRDLDTGSNFGAQGGVLQNASESFPNDFSVIRNRAIDHLDRGYVGNFINRENSNEYHLNEIDVLRDLDTASNFGGGDVLQNASESFPNGSSVTRNRAIDHLDHGYIENFNDRENSNEWRLNEIYVLRDLDTGSNFRAQRDVLQDNIEFLLKGQNEVDAVLNYESGSGSNMDFSAQENVLQNASESFPDAFNVIRNRAINHLDIGNFNDRENSNKCQLNEIDVLRDLDTGSNFGAQGDDPIHEESELEIVDVETFTFGSTEPTGNEDIAICNIGVSAHRGCDDTNMIVPTSDQKGKQYCCIYCLKRFQKLERHLRTVHKREPDVQRFLAYRPRTKQRKALIATIRNRGQFKWNSDKDLNGGELATVRRPHRKFQRKAGGFLSCAKCLAKFTSTGLTRHFNKCTNNTMKGERVAQALGRAAENRIHSKASDDLSGIFSQIRVNRSSEYVRQICFDWLVITYGNDLCLNYSPDYQHGYIRGKLRACAKVLKAAKTISSEVSDFSTLYHVKQCNTVVDAIRQVAKFDFQSKLFGAPGTASTLVTLMNTVGELLLIESMKRDEPEKERDIERFLTVFKKEVKTKINKLVAVTQAKNKRRKKSNIPTLADVNKLVSFLNVERDACLIQLTKEYLYQNWIKLSQLTMASILVFNRRRTGETRNITVEDYLEREIIADQCDPLLDILPEEIKVQIKSRMQIRGKLIRQVPVLLKYSYDDCIALLIRHRKDAGIPDTNEFLFALPTKTSKAKTIDACTVMRSFANVCGAKNPLSLRGTNLRKHMASYCGTKNLSDNDVTNVCNFLGHDDKIHRDIYRHNSLAQEVVQMAYLLNAAQGTDVTNSSSEEEEDEDEEDENDENEPEKLIPTTSGRRKSIKSSTTNKVRKVSTSDRRENGKSLIATAKKVVGKLAGKKRINNPTPGTKNRETKKTNVTRINKKSKKVR